MGCFSQEKKSPPFERRAGSKTTKRNQSERMVFYVQILAQKSSPAPIPISAAGRHVGEVVRDVFQKSIVGSRHILRVPPSIALSVESLELAEGAGAREIQIRDSETGRLYTCTVEHFRRRAFPIQRGGFEPQLALLLEEFDISAPLELISRAPKRGEIKRKPGNGKRVRNPRGVIVVSPRQMVFKGMI